MSSVVTNKVIWFGLVVGTEVGQEPLKRRLKLLERKSLSMVASLQKLTSRPLFSQQPAPRELSVQLSCYRWVQQLSVFVLTHLFSPLFPPHPAYAPLFTISIAPGISLLLNITPIP